MGRDDGDDNDGDDDIVVLTSDDGEEIAFEVLGVVEVEGQDYALLTPAEPDDDDEGDGVDVHVFRYKETEDGPEFDDDVDDETFAKVQEAAKALFGDEEEA
jgi:uncharacterized protein YrzB (UPF0473 family)